MRTVRIFTSSPGDALSERMRLDRVVERLNGDFSGTAKLEAIRWEREFYKAHATFQAQIPEAAECDIVVAILRHRLGTELPDDFPPMPNGEPYPSGTAYEVLTAIEERRRSNLPDVYVFRYPEPPMVRLDEDETNALVSDQWNRLKAFFDTWFRTPEGHFKAAFQEFRSTDEFETQIETLLRGWLEEKVLKHRSVVWPIETRGSPFCGLAAFGAKHAPVFFGRSRDIARATDDLKEAAERGAPFLLVVGASGGGKSSLARAGLVPRITTPGVVSTVDAWRVAQMRPGGDGGAPVAALAACLFEGEAAIAEEEQGRPPALPEIGEGDYGTPEDIATLMSHADETAMKPILHALDKVAKVERGKHGFDRSVRVNLLLVVDQLDELFADYVDEDQRAAFVRVLSMLAATGRVWIITTLRADLYERYLQIPELLDLKARGAAYDLALPGPVEMAEIVRAPAKAAGLVYEADPQGGETLDDRLLRDADSPDMLPLLQFTLDQLFEQREVVGEEVRLTFAAYERLGGVAGAIDEQAEKAIAYLQPGDIDTLPKLLRLLVAQRQVDGSSAGAGYTIRSVRLADLGEDEPLIRLVDALSRARILMVSDEGSGASVRLVHQRILECWSRARQAVRMNADFYRILDDVKSQCRRWIASGTHPSTLLQRGRPLTEARILASEYPDATSQGILDFISASISKARFRAIGWAAVVYFPVLLPVYAVLHRFLGSGVEAVSAYLVVFGFFLMYPAAVVLNMRGYLKKIKRTRLRIDCEDDLYAPSIKSTVSLHIVFIRTAMYFVIVLSAAITVPFVATRLDIAPENLYDSPLHTTINSAYLGLLVLMIPFANSFPKLAFRYTAGARRPRSGRIVEMPGPIRRLAPYPLAVLAGLALVSGALSGLILPSVGGDPPQHALHDPVYYAPPLLFTCVIVAGELLWVGGGLRVVAQVAAGTVAAWFLAYHTGYYLSFSDDTFSTLFSGCAAGAMGALVTALAVPTLRRARRWEISTAIGAIAGLSLWLSLESLSLYMFTAWQLSFAAYFGFCLQRSVVAGAERAGPVAT